MRIMLNLLFAWKGRKMNFSTIAKRMIAAP